MGFLECHVHEERLAVYCHLVHHIDGFVGHIVGIVEVLGYAVGKDGLFVMNKREGVEVVRYAPDGSPVLIESPVAGISLDGGKGTVVEIALVREPFHLVGIVADAFGKRQVPLTAHAGMVSGVLQRLWDSDTVACEALSHTGNTYGLGVASRQQLGSGGTAAPRIIELRETHTRGSQLVQVGALHLPAETLKVRIPHVIHYDEHDVRTLGILGDSC